MTVDERIRESLAAVPLGDGPTDADRAGVEVAAGRERQRRTRRRLAVASLAAALVVVVAIVAWPRGGAELRTAGPGVDGTTAPPASVTPSTSVTADGWIVVTDPSTGFTMEVPPTWRYRADAHVCGTSGLGVRNDGDPPRWHSHASVDCRPSPSLGSGSVVISVVHLEYERPSNRPHVMEAADLFPLDGSMFPWIEDPDIDQNGYGFSFALQGDDGYQFQVQVGRDVSGADRQAAVRVLSSMRPPDRDEAEPRSTTVSTDVRDSGPRLSENAVDTVALPSIPPMDVTMGAIVQGPLEHEGRCLYLRTNVGARIQVIWSGSAEMDVRVRDDSLVAIRQDGQPLPSVDRLDASGGYVPADWLDQIEADAENLRPECATGTIAVVNPVAP